MKAWMNKKGFSDFILAHCLLAVLLWLVQRPGAREVEESLSFTVAILLMEAACLLKLLLAKRRGKSLRVPSDIMLCIWGFLLLWEVAATQRNMLHPVLFPTPENVFHVFPSQYEVLLQNVASSLELLVVGVAAGLGIGTLLGVIVGWIPGLADVFYPIANVLTPIPPIVYAPYIIILMPSFRSASAVIIILGIFFPTFLRMILRMRSLEPAILDSARVLNVNTFTMITQIVLPYILPEVISGLRITVTTSVTLLIFAEMMGATSGMGYYIVNYNTFANYTNVVAGFIVVGVVVTILEWFVSLIQKYTIKWK